MTSSAHMTQLVVAIHNNSVWLQCIKHTHVHGVVFTQPSSLNQCQKDF